MQGFGKKGFDGIYESRATWSAMQLRRENNPTASALFGIAAVQFLVGFIGLFIYFVNPDADIPQLKWFLYHFQSGAFTALDWVVTFSGVIFTLLALLAYRVRLLAASLAAAVCVGQLLLQGAGALSGALIVKVLVVTLLVVALAAALRRPSHYPQTRTETA
jgi:hypothetical protein